MPKILTVVALLLALTGQVASAAVEHRVRKGETLAEIADLYRVSVKEIKNANNITNANRISIGQKLTIPGVSVATGAKHTVRSGETLDEIAKRYGVTIQELKTANQITNANRIRIGQTLVIPGLAAKPAAPNVTVSSTGEHTVQASETLTEIASAYQVSVQALKSANDLDDANLISVGQKLRIPDGKPQYIDYTIRRGDSLSDIARDYGVALKTITSLNSISNPSRIKIGQVIKIPSHAGITTSRGAPQLSTSDLSALRKTRPNKDKWRHIVIHHSASKSGSAKAFDRFHREERNMVNGLAYHFVIGNGNGMGDGELAIGDRWKRQIQGGHLASYTLNQISIGICLVGDFSKTKPTAKQMATLEALVRYLMANTQVPVARVTTHTLIHPKHTLCPGKYFPTAAFKKKLGG
ncbi:LysM peptidoglycan-binding domain-containing protein [Pelagicoccus albus]|uniref:LysM peptidoglycan-binding domain-containing protein n=1 Tax=Pelagicoccus albus TaxID=415222 RepID=A0A7X1B753_9BACT|nr:LysM peptidoglycan-binding domain-containing protein [Pelagicoccus albus]MBC2606886.1 LysM peptidoglycan-binding domain-containing protein [Pelagicoccus albus]